MIDRPRNNAFTLVEMLIGMALIGLIVTMVYGSYAATTRSLGVYSSRMTCSDRAHLVLRLMAHQLRGAYAPPAATNASTLAARSSQPINSPPARAVPTSWALFFRGDPREAGGEILCFLTTGGLSQELGRPGGLSRVRYRYETQGGVLSLCCESGVHPAGDPGDSPIWRPVLRGVTSIDLEFYDGRQWQPTWNSGATRRLPRAVRMVLTIADESGRTHCYETAVPIACHSSVPKQLH